MVDIFGNSIVDAFTGTVPVNAIYSYGSLVWQRAEPIPSGFTRVESIYWDGVVTAPHLYVPLTDQTLTAFRIDMDIELIRRPANLIVGWSYGGDETSPSIVVSFIKTNDTIPATPDEIFYGDYMGGFLGLKFPYLGVGRMTYDLELGTMEWKGADTFSMPLLYHEPRTGVGFHFFNSNAPGGYLSANKIYKVVVSSHGETIMKLLPVVEDATGRVGLYDTISGNFHWGRRISYDTIA